MQRAVAVGCFLLTLSGPFVAQIEAAEALACSLAELTDGNVIEPIDADGQGVSVVAFKGEPQAGHLFFAFGAPSLFFVQPPFRPLTPSPVAPRRPGASPRSPAPQAWLQVFRF